MALPKFLDNIVILCFERRFSKQNSVIRLKWSILVPQIFGLATPLMLLHLWRRFLVFRGNYFLIQYVWCVIMKFFRSPCRIQTPSRAVSCSLQEVACRWRNKKYYSCCGTCCSLLCNYQERYYCIIVIRCCRCTLHNADFRTSRE